MTDADARTTFERALARTAREDAADELQRARELLSEGRRVRRSFWRRPSVGRVVFVLAGLLVVRVVMTNSSGRRGTEPIGAVATAEGAGIGSSVAAFLPVSSVEPEPTPSPSPPVATPAPAAAASPPPRPRPQRARPRAAPARVVEPDRPVEVVALPAARPVPVPTPAPTPKPAPLVLNMGTRIEATLEAPVRTGATLAPATALVSQDVTVGERVALPAGARLVGSAFATTGDDRVQILWRAAVIDGRTYRLAGEALSADGSQGLAGKVVKKKGKGVLRRIGATVVGTAGEALGYGIPGGDGLTGLAEDALAARAGRELVRATHEREWLQADKVIELKAGAALVVYVSSDVLIAADGAGR